MSAHSLPNRVSCLSALRLSLQGGRRTPLGCLSSRLLPCGGVTPDAVRTALPNLGRYVATNWAGLPDGTQWRVFLSLYLYPRPATFRFAQVVSAGWKRKLFLEFASGERSRLLHLATPQTSRILYLQWKR